jgi:alkylresorcinol/alkylpyrone synthase
MQGEVANPLGRRNFMARIVSIATCAPPHALDSSQTEELLRRHLIRWKQPSDFYVKILRKTQIETRHTVFGANEVINEHSLQDRNELYIRTCIELGERCVQSALIDARLNPQDIASIITVSCTGFMIPSVDAYLINRLQMSPAVRRLPITELGCAGGAMGLTRAWEQLRAYPDARVLLLSVELPSLTFQPRDPRRSQVIASLIFADGAASVVLAHDGLRPSPRLLASRTFTITGTIEDMGYQLDENGLHIVLSPQVPSYIQKALGGQIDALLYDQHVVRDQIRWCAMHPGAPKLIELAQEELQLSRDQLAASWKVLRNYGNTSSSSILFVLAEMMQHPPAEPGDLGLIMAFGPGVSGEIILARWEA